jgi:ATP-dependent helicase HrpB
MSRAPLPIDVVLPELRSALRAASTVILQAPPGAGKSTGVPLALLAEPWMQGKTLVMLEPRRVAARAVAQRMASLLGEAVGRTVGFRTRLATQVSGVTRIEVVTEGILLRRLHHDPALGGIAAVLFDECHERSLLGDLSLTLTLDARQHLAPDLKLLLMSATLDSSALTRLLPEAVVVSAAGRSFPVVSHYVGSGLPLSPRDLVPRMVQVIHRVLHDETGDVLVFLPGAGAIRQVQQRLVESNLDHSIQITPLYGELSAAQQDAALAPTPAGQRKLVLATNLAETSLTIPGVRVVIDSGLVKRAIFDPLSGMSRLETGRISRAAAEQRQGRAGRLAPGVCYRLWSEGAQASLSAFTPPEILSADLSPLALELAQWGVRDAQELSWLDPPPAAMLDSARDLLRRLNALDEESRITAHGRHMAQLSVHPRLAHMLLRAQQWGDAALAIQLAVLLSEREVSKGERQFDIALYVLQLQQHTPPRLQKLLTSLEKQLAKITVTKRHSDAVTATTDVGVLLALAFPDRIARRREGAAPRYVLANGRGAYFVHPNSLSQQGWLVAVELDDQAREASILLAAAVTRTALETAFADDLTTQEHIRWDRQTQAVLAIRQRSLHGLVLEERVIQDADAEQLQAAMLQGVFEMGPAALPWTDNALMLQARSEFVRRANTDTTTIWPDLSNAALSATLAQWLPPWLIGITRRDHLQRLDLNTILLAQLTPAQQRQLTQLAPAHLTLPNGRTATIDYRNPSGPTVAVRLQDAFGLATSPRIGAGHVPLTFALLSPARRPVQITRDLAGFWRGSYHAVRKEMRSRYPKHHWPEDPAHPQK